MKKMKSQLSLAFICIILGFMITYQYRLSFSNKKAIDTRQITDLVKQNETLKKQRDELMQRLRNIK